MWLVICLFLSPQCDCRGKDNDVVLGHHKLKTTKHSSSIKFWAFMYSFIWQWRFFSLSPPIEKDESPLVNVLLNYTAFSSCQGHRKKAVFCAKHGSTSAGFLCHKFSSPFEIFSWKTCLETVKEWDSPWAIYTSECEEGSCCGRVGLLLFRLYTHISLLFMCCHRAGMKWWDVLIWWKTCFISRKEFLRKSEIFKNQVQKGNLARNIYCADGFLGHTSKKGITSTFY